MKKYDVIVVGGGLTGFAAAVASVRSGAKTLLVEKGNCLGGEATKGLVRPFMPYWTKKNGERFDLARGLFEELHLRINKSLSAEDLKLVLNEMCEEEGVDLLFHAYLFKVEKEAGKVKALSFATRAGELQLEADYFIDTTGDALLAHLAGCPTALGRESDNLCQPMTLCFRLGNVDVKRVYEIRYELDEIYKKHLAAGEFINPRENLLFFQTPVDTELHFNTTRVIKLNPTDPWDYTKAEIIARKQVFETIEFLKKYGEGFENCYLEMTASEIGVRESRKIIGDYVLTETDCVQLTKFDDAIAACNYMIDIHNPAGSGTYGYYFPEGEWYTIPYRSLIPQGVENLLVAGRCISSDHSAQASYRIMPIVTCIGEAAGTAIGLAVKNKLGVREVDVKELQTKLKENGAFIGI